MSYFILYPDVVLVNGAVNSLLLDFRTHNYISINGEIAEFLIPRTLKMSAVNSDDKEFITYLVEKEYGLFCTEKELEYFQPINDKWEYPAEITNAIIEIDENLTVDLDAVFEQLGQLQCEHIELRLNDSISDERLMAILKIIGANGVHGVQLVMPFNKAYTNDFIFSLNKKCNVFIYAVLFFNTPTNFKPSTKKGVVSFKYLNRPLTCLDCGVISEANFIVDIPFYAESIAYNTCLNRKISITAKGAIKNCPSFEKSFGNIAELSLKKVLDNGEFTDFWTINKDEIEVCKDCEFRRICTDCRAFTENSDKYGKPLKCNYDPYKGIWNKEYDENQNSF